MYLFVSGRCQQYRHINIPQQMCFIETISRAAKERNPPQSIMWLCVVWLPWITYSPQLTEWKMSLIQTNMGFALRPSQLLAGMKKESRSLSAGAVPHMQR